jgi:predicted glycosyltransferase
VLFFGHAGFAYGHVARGRKLARHLVRTRPLDAYVVSSCPEYEPTEVSEAVHEVLLPSFRLASPDVVPDGLPLPARASSLPDVPADALSAHRGRLLLALVAHLRPRAVLLEGVPFVRPDQATTECGPALAFLRAESPATLRCAGFNGVSTGLWAAEHAALIDRLLGELDHLFVYVDPAERDELFARCPALVPLASRTRLVGYVVGDAPERAVAEPRVLATFGGGVDAFRRIMLVGEAFEVFAGRRPGWTLDVVTGGQLPDQAYGQVVERFGAVPGICVRRLVPGLSRWLNRYRLVVSMSGYNTCTELCQASTRSIVLPRIGPRFLEQLEQAQKFQRAGVVDRIVDAGDTTPARLAEVMEETLATPPSARRALDTGGAEATARWLAS